MQVKLNLGSGAWLRGYPFINVDNFHEEKDILSRKGYYKKAIIEKGYKYVKADIMHLPFKDNYADYVELMNVIEHFPFRQVIPALQEIRRVMKPGAKLVIQTNDVNGLILDWARLAMDREFKFDDYIDVIETLWGNQSASGEFHLVGFNPQFLDACLSTAGFTKGHLAVLPKGMKAIKVGTVKPFNNKTVFRNDVLVAEVTK